MVGTYLLVFVVIFSAVHSKSAAGNAAPIAIGWAVMLAHIVLIPYTGCGINPARSLGPMVANSFGGVDTWSRGYWVYYVAPFAGAALASFTFALLYGFDREGEAPPTEAEAKDEAEPKLEEEEEVEEQEVEEQAPPTKNDGEDVEGV